MRLRWSGPLGLGVLAMLVGSPASALQLGLGTYEAEVDPASASFGTAAVSPPASSVAYGAFDISVNFTGTPTLNQIAAFQAAETFWESVILGYKDPGLATAMAGVNGGSVLIDAYFGAIDGPSGILAQAGPTQILATGGYVGIAPSTSNVIVATNGVMNFDTADIDALEIGGSLEAVIVHEMAHVLGFLPFFWDFVAATDGSGTDLTYTGVNGLTAYQNEFDPLATFVPIEDEGEDGTAYAHWDEQLFANYDPLAPVAGSTGNPELMTGYLNTPLYVSMTTIASFEDLGYATIWSNPPIGAVPLPLPGMMLAAGVVALAARARSRPRTAG